MAASPVEVPPVPPAAADSGAPAAATTASEAQAASGGVVLGSVASRGRAVAFAVAGDPGGAPVLFFYPAGGNRRMLQSLHEAAKAASLRLICANRPGRGGTSRAPKAGPAGHAAAVCGDAAAVLDHLGVERASLLFMCAGTPFAFLFAARKPQRTTGQLLGLASWVSPADFGEASQLYRLGAALPAWFAGSLVGSSFASGPVALRWLPDAAVAHLAKQGLSPVELEAFGRKFPEHAQFVRTLRWQSEELGGHSADMGVLLSSLPDLGTAYCQVVGEVTLVHGEEDTLSPVGGAEWLAEQLPRARLRRVPAGTHEGVLRLLHPEVDDALRSLAAPILTSRAFAAAGA